MRIDAGRWKGLKWVAVAGAAMLAVLILSGCNSGGSQVSKSPSAESVAAELSGKSQGGATRSPGLTQSSSGGSVTLDVTWENPKASGPLLFDVEMNTHSVELDGYDLGKLVVLRNDQGLEVKAQRWDAPSGGHHRSGSLTFPATDSSGRPIAGPTTKSLELVIRDVAGVKERVLKWEVPS